MGLARRTATQTNERDAKGTGLIMGQSLSAASAMGDARCLSSVFPGNWRTSALPGPWTLVTPPRPLGRDQQRAEQGWGVPRLRC